MFGGHAATNAHRGKAPRIMRPSRPAAKSLPALVIGDEVHTYQQRAMPLQNQTRKQFEENDDDDDDDDTNYDDDDDDDDNDVDDDDDDGSTADLGKRQAPG